GLDDDRVVRLPHVHGRHPMPEPEIRGSAEESALHGLEHAVHVLEHPPEGQTVPWPEATSPVRREASAAGALQVLPALAHAVTFAILILRHVSSSLDPHVDDRMRRAGTRIVPASGSVPKQPLHDHDVVPTTELLRRRTLDADDGEAQPRMQPT